MTVITRFAPSPTGFLHIGGARTALFNWLYARHFGGKFYLRIEDTDRERSTQAATDAIIEGMQWLGLEWDGEIVHQFSRAARHAEVAREMLKAGKAFECYCTQAELDAFRAAFPNQKFKSPWRAGLSNNAMPPKGVKPTIRLLAPTEGETTVDDAVQGKVSVKNSELDDMVLLRSDGTPTYMLAVVVDDHDMGITNIIRGDDHFTNSFRQIQIYNAMGWETPSFAHIPLIHGTDGAKLSKRHGALGVDEYRKMGYLPEAILNYLLRLGWSHGDDEFISTKQATLWFNLDSVGKSPSRFDFAKLDSVNAHYMREASDERLVDLILSSLSSPLEGERMSASSQNAARIVGGVSEMQNPVSPPLPNPPPQGGRELLLRAIPSLKQRAKTLVELAESAKFYLERPTPDDAAKEALTKGRELLTGLIPALEALNEWTHDTIQAACKAYAEQTGQKLGAIMSPIRAGITGKTASPSMFEVLEILGREESLERLNAAISA